MDVGRGLIHRLRSVDNKRESSFPSLELALNYSWFMPLFLAMQHLSLFKYRWKRFKYKYPSRKIRNPLMYSFKCAFNQILLDSFFADIKDGDKERSIKGLSHPRVLISSEFSWTLLGLKYYQLWLWKYFICVVYCPCFFIQQ